MATANSASNPGPTSGSITTWWTGEQVRQHLAHCRDPEAALLKLGDDIASGRATATVSSARDPRNGGRPKVHAQPPSIDSDMWWRIMDLMPAIDIWSAPILSVLGTGNEKAVDLVGLRFCEQDVRRVADEHGFQAPAALKPKNRGGISCRAHGVVIAQMTLLLMSRDREHVLSLTGVELEKEIQALYIKQDRRGLSPQNVGRIANGILEVVHQHYSKGSVHSVQD